MTWLRSNDFSRKIVLGALALELGVHALGVLNGFVHIAPLAFTYVELTGFAIVALLAGVGVWTAVQASATALVAVGNTIALCIVHEIIAEGDAVLVVHDLERIAKPFDAPLFLHSDQDDALSPEPFCGFYRKFLLLNSYRRAVGAGRPPRKVVRLPLTY